MAGSVEDYFDALGAGWDRLRRGFFSSRVRERAMEAAGLEPGCKAADLGAGTGFITRGLLGRGVRVVAVDRSPAMLAALRSKFEWSGEIDCILAEAERLPIADAAVDHCFANMLLHHVERPPVAIAEMRRIVKPGGRVVLTDLEEHGFTFLAREHHDRWMGFRPSAVRRWFDAAGLENVRVERLGEDCCAASAEGCRTAIGILVASGTRPMIRA